MKTVIGSIKWNNYSNHDVFYFEIMHMRLVNHQSGLILEELIQNNND